MALKWPGVIKPGTVINDVGAHEDMMPTFAAAVGEADLAGKLQKGLDIGGTTYKVHLDGYNWLPYLKGGTQQAPRREFLYWTDDGDLAALRYDQWKLVFMEQRAHGYEVWQEPLTVLRFPKLFTLRGDPFERADHEGIDYPKWRLERAFLLVPAQVFVQQWLSSFKDFPPRQKPASFGIDQVMDKIMNQAAGAGK
jgi:arylsulfatase A-like enzyme